MAMSKKKLLKISKGQIAKQLIERTDIGILDDSGQEITNFYNSKYGALVSTSGTELKYTFGNHKKIKLQNIILPNSKDGFVAFNGTDHTVYVFDTDGNLISNVVNFAECKESNYKNIQLIQNEEIILICTKDAPLFQMDISNLPNITIGVFSIPAKRILKSSNIIIPSATPILYRMGDSDIPSNPNELGIKIGNYVYPNSGTDDPNTSFPWNVKKLVSLADTNKFTVVDAKITSVGNNLKNNDIIKTEATNISLQIVSVKQGQSLTVVNPETIYDTDPAGENLAILNNTNITVSIVSEATTTTTTPEATEENPNPEPVEKTTYKVASATIYSLQNQYQEDDIVETDTKIKFKIISIEENANLQIIAPSEIYSFNPAGENVALIGNGTGMTANITSQTIPNIWEDYAYTPVNLDIIKDTWNNNIWQFTNNIWIVPSNVSNDYTMSYRVSNTSGTIKIIPNGTYYYDVPSGYDPTEYIKGLFIGIKFDGGNNGIGEALITDVFGTVSGQKFIFTSFTAQTILSFLSANTNYNGGVFKLTQTKVFDGNYPNTNDNPSSTTNYPLNIFFYQQRLIIAGTTYNPQQFIFSKIKAYNNFTDENYSDSAFQLIIGGTEKEEIKAIILNQGIQIFCRNNEWLLNDTEISRMSGFIKNSSIGTNGIQPVISANGITLFTPKNGKGLIGFVYNYDTASFHTPYISLFTDLLNEPITDLYLKRGLDSQDDTLLFICDEQGNLIIGNYQSEHEIQAFCKRSSANTKFLQSIQAEQNIYFLTERNNITSLEKINKNKYTACSISNFVYTPSAGTIVFNAPQYNNQEINVYDENRKYVGTYKATNGLLQIPEGKTPKNISEIGFNIHSVFESNPQNLGMETFNLYKNIPNLKLLLTDDSKEDYVKVNGKYGRNKDGFLSYYRVSRPLRDCRFKIENDIYPCEILSIEIELEV